MIGRRIQSRRGISWGGVFFALIGLAMIAASVAEKKVDFAIGAAMPIAIAFALFLTIDPEFSAIFTEEGLEYETRNGSLTLPYDRIEGVWTPKRKIDPKHDGPNSYTIVVTHPMGSLRIPKRTDVLSDDIYRHLLQSTPVGGSDEVHHDLSDYLRDQMEEFGPERVWSYRASPNKGVNDYRRLRAVMAAVFAIGIAWCIYGGVSGEDRHGWIGAGAFVMVMSAIFFLATFVSRDGAVGTKFKGWKESSLVISPLGLALVQGDIRGEMTWHELRDVKLQDVGGVRLYEHRTAGRSIVLKIDGANIRIPDIYDRPLFAIYQCIRLYWR